MAEETRLGYWSTINKIYHDRYQCSGMATAVVCLQGPVTPAAIRQSLFLLQRRHPLLQATITATQRYYHFDFERYLTMTADQANAAVPLQILNRDTDSRWAACTQAEIARDFDPEAPCLWRAILLQAPDSTGPSELIMLFHHAIADGMSLSCFVDDLLTLCNRITLGEPLAADQPVEKLFPPPETMIVRPEGPAGPSKQQPAAGTPILWRHETSVPLAARTPVMLFRHLETDLMARLRSRCRREQTTVNGALTVAYQRAAAEHLPAGAYARLTTAVNLRRFCEPPVDNQHFGCFIMMAQSVHNLSAQPFWDQARACQQQLQHEITGLQRQGFAPPAFHKSFIAAAMTKNIEQGNNDHAFAGGLAVSNMGVLNYSDPNGPVQIRELYFGAPQLSGLYMLFLVVCTLNEKLYYTFSFPEPLLSRQSATQIADTFSAELQACC